MTTRDPSQWPFPRYAIVSHDWQRFDRRYAVIDTHQHDKPIIQTNDFARAIQVRDEMNQEIVNLDGGCCG